MEAGKIKLSTIHSFKGCEIKTAILLIMGETHSDNYDKLYDDPPEAIPVDELIYTALTRPRDNLIVINIGNTRYDSFFRANIPEK